MFNEKQKEAFIIAYTQSISTAKVATTIFNRCEKYENQWNADICTKSTDELQPVMDEVFGLRAKSKWMTLSILREYAKWCINEHIPDACDGLLHINAPGSDKIRRQMVSSPYHLQLCLDQIFDAESFETVDNLYRCYYWMAYGGLKEEEVARIKKSDVDLKNLFIRSGKEIIPIYREGLPAFRNVMQLNRFVYRNEKYSHDTHRDRASGDLFLRSVNPTIDILSLRSTTSHVIAEAVERGRTDIKISFRRVGLSGLFYRTYEMERAGLPVDFADAAIRFMDGRQYNFKSEKDAKLKQRAVEREYLEDYMRWKLAFPV